MSQAALAAALAAVWQRSASGLPAVCQRVGWDIDRNTIAKIEGRLRWVGDFELVYLAKAFKCQIDH